MTNSKTKLQDNIKELDELVKYFENNDQAFDLEAGISKYETAMKIVQSVKKELESYELKIKEIEDKYSMDEEIDED